MRYKFLSLCFLFCAGTAMAGGVMDYDAIMGAVHSRDLNLLKKLVSSGYDVNASANGMTPLCETVYTKDYQGYEMLMTQGAALYVPCMRNMPPQVSNSFYSSQPKMGTYYEGTMANAHATSGWGASQIPDTVLYSGEAIIGAAAVGAIALFGSGGHGGGGGGGSDPDDPDVDPDVPWVPPEPIDIVWDSPFDPTEEDIKAFETDEYEGLVNNAVHSALPAIHASSAYARGYTGFIVKRDSKTGDLIGEGAEAISEEPIKVAVLDNGFFLEHNELDGAVDSSLYDGDEITKKLNFVYGACKNTDSKNCWKATTKVGKSDVVIERNNVGRLVSRDTWEKYRLNTDYYIYDGTDAHPMGEVDLLWDKTENGYVYLVNGEVQFGSYLYKMSEDENVLDINKIVMKWARNDVSEFYYCTKDLSGCVIKSSLGYSLLPAATVAELKELQNQNKLDVNLTYDVHGNLVTGIVAARKDDKYFHGVAYNASVIPISLDFDTGETVQHISTAIDLGADIINLSLAPSYMSLGSLTPGQYLTGYLKDRPDWTAAYKKAAETNTILVFSAGNYYQDDESSFYASAPATKMFGPGSDYDLSSLVVVVVAVDSDNKLAPYSAKCGKNQHWCIAAPGSDLLSSEDADGQGSYYSSDKKGTSFSAPVVSGALAVIKSAFPHLTNQQVVQILFETATPLGNPEVYGYGLVNLDAATKPVGDTTLALDAQASGASVKAMASRVSIPVSLSNIASKLPEAVVVLDKYQRGFAVPTSSFVRTEKHENQLENRFKSMMAGDEKHTSSSGRFEMAWSDRHESHRTSDMKYGFVDVQVKPFETLSFSAFYNANTATNGGTYLGRTLNNPFTKMKEAWGLNGSYQFAQNWTIDTMWATGQNAFVDEDDWNKMDTNHVNAVQTTLAYSGLSNTTFKFVSGLTNERSSALGLWGTGAFRSGNTKTSFLGAGAAFRLTDTVQLEGMYYYGMAHTSKQDNLIRLSDITADSFAVTASYTPDAKHTYGLALVSPMRIRSGTATLDLPVARDTYDDVMYRSVVKAGLKPSAREYDLSSYYTNQLTQGISLQSEIGVRFNPDHQAGAAPDYRGLLSVKIEM